MVLCIVVIVLVFCTNSAAVRCFAIVVLGNHGDFAVIRDVVDERWRGFTTSEWAGEIVIAIVAKLPVMGGIQINLRNVLVVNLEREFGVVSSAGAAGAFPVLFVFNTDANRSIAGVGGGDGFCAAPARSGTL